MEGQFEKKKKLKITTQDEEEDRISKLADNVIHKILRFVDSKVAIESSDDGRLFGLVSRSST